MPAWVPRYPVTAVALVYGAVGVGLLFVPLFNLLHVESAAVIAGVAFFAAGLAALAAFTRGASFRRVVVEQEVLLFLPLAFLTASLVWVDNCDYVRGLLFYALFPGISVALAVALAWALTGIEARPKKTLFACVGMVMLLGGVLSDIGWNPQFYTYNHVFGGVLGPIYDEELAVRPGLFVFRGLSLLWAVLFWYVGTMGRRTERAARDLPVLAAVMLSIGLLYLFSARLGMTSPAWYIQEQLGGHYASERFDLYYDPASLEPSEVERIIQDHEFRYHQIAAVLNSEPEGRVQSYLYPDPDAKAALTGARYTNVAPVWLRQPQVHVLLDSYAAVFPHELAHVFSRAFGLPMLNASFSVGLVEGWAVALEPPDGRPSPHEQVAVTLVKQQQSGQPTVGLTVASTLAPLGFWTGRGAVSYTTMGSFVQFLIEAYGIEAFKAVYAWGNWEDVYGKPVEELAEEWEASLLALPMISRDTEAWVSRRFAVPSLFEKACPHYIPLHRRALEEAHHALTHADTTRALERISFALDERPTWGTALADWARIQLAKGRATEVLDRLDTLAITQQSPTLAWLTGDAWAMLVKPEAARVAYARAYQQIPMFAEELRARLWLRVQWRTAPDLIAALVHEASPDNKARQLAAFEADLPSVAFAQAWLLIEAEEYEKALSVLQRLYVGTIEWPSKAALESLERYQLALFMQTYRLLHRFEDARVVADQLVQAYVGEGAFNQAAYYQDWSEKLAWLAEQPFHALGGPAASLSNRE